MKLDTQTLRLAAVGAIVVLLYGSRFARGKASNTAAGLVFTMKPLFVFSRIAALAIYVFFFSTQIIQTGAKVPPWFYVLFVVVIGLGLLQFPATITLGEDGLTQTFWFLKKKAMLYSNVNTLRQFQAGRAIRVVSVDGTAITHTTNHCAPDRFLAEMQERTNQRLQP